MSIREMETQMQHKRKAMCTQIHTNKYIEHLSGFRTVSDDAVLVLAKTMPIDILADEMRWIYFRRLECPERMATIRVEERKTSMHKWQSRWENSLRGKWTFHLAPYITPWLENEHCELNYWVLQEAPLQIWTWQFPCMPKLRKWRGGCVPYSNMLSQI